MSKKRRKNKKYSNELKIAAVKSYLAGEGTQVQICKKFRCFRTSATTKLDKVV